MKNDFVREIAALAMKAATPEDRTALMAFGTEVDRMPKIVVAVMYNDIARYLKDYELIGDAPYALERLHSSIGTFLKAWDDKEAYEYVEFWRFMMVKEPSNEV